MPAADERHLIGQAREGNQQAFRQLVECHMKQAYNLAYGFVGSHEEAEDIAQEAFVRVHRSLGSFRGESSFATWLHRIVVNLALNQTRRKQRMTWLCHAEVEPYAGDGGATDHERLETRTHLERAIHELPTLQRAVVILRHLEGMPTQQVSGILRCSEGTVKTHLFRAMKKLRKRLAYLNVETA
jgi:RNA polymerase sigma-70 factor, ECF subfamily